MIRMLEELDSQIHSIESRIGEEAAALDGEDDAEHSILLRARIQGMTMVLKKLKDARASLAPAVFGFLEIEQKFSRWRELCRAAREARGRMEKCVELLTAARAGLPELDNLVARAEHAFVEHKKCRASLEISGQYISGQKLRVVKDEEARLSAQYAAAIERRRDGKVREGQAHAAWFAAAKAFDKACFDERMGRLPMVAEKEYHAVSLSGVDAGGVSSLS
jgi:hypothetical protein